MESQVIDDDAMYLIGLILALEAKEKAGEITDRFHIALIRKADKCVMNMQTQEYEMYKRACYWLLTVIYPLKPEPKEPCPRMLHS